MKTSKDYTILFYKKKKIIAAGTVHATPANAKNIATLLANADGKYLPKQGDYDEVGFIKQINVNRLVEKALKDYE